MEASKLQFKLIIGLGNPAKKHQHTYHNVGHLFIDYLKSHWSLVTGHWLKTDVYMNESGSFAKKMLKKSGIKPEELLVVQDDSDISLGDYKLSFGRGSAGHKGIESIIKSLGTKNFWRLRIGIRPKQKERTVRKKAEEFVLKTISAENKKNLNNIFKEAADSIGKAD